MKKIYNVVEQSLENVDRYLPTIWSFSTKEKALKYAQKRIDMILDLDTSHNDFMLDYNQGVIYIPGVIDIRIWENQIDIIN